MKGFLVVAMTLMLAVCLTSSCCCCEVMTYVDETETITTTVDREFIIALDSNPTTGYDWEESHDETMLSLEESKYNPDEKEPGLVGAGGTQYFLFKALKAGKTEITLTYKQRWEEEFADQKVFKVDIR